MTRREAEDYVYESYLAAVAVHDVSARDADLRHPEYSRSVIRMLAPEADSVVITGSKGKGSVAVMIESLLRTRYVTGMLTSPHLLDFCERFCINGRKVGDDAFSAQVKRVRELFGPVTRSIPHGHFISPMGVQAAVAMGLFADAGVERMVLECGKGARYDDVDNVSHRFAVINPVFLEHTRELGATLGEIAADKAYVIIEDTECVFVASQRPEVMDIIRRRAGMMKCEVREFGRDFSCGNVRLSDMGTTFDVLIGEERINDINVPLLGRYQAENCALAIAVACAMMQERLPVNAIRKALEAVRRPGRMEILQRKPVVLLDACINRASCAGVIEILAEIGVERCCTVIGIPDDKDYIGVAGVMAPLSETLIMTRSSNPHYSFNLAEQKRRLCSSGIKATVSGSVADALSCALSTGLPVVILGTTSVVAEVKRLFL